MAPPTWLHSLNQIQGQSPEESTPDFREDPVALFEAWTNVDFNAGTAEDNHSPLGHALNLDSDLSFVDYKTLNRRNYELGFGNTGKSPFVPQPAATGYGLASDGSTILSPQISTPIFPEAQTIPGDWLARLEAESNRIPAIDPALSVETPAVSPAPAKQVRKSASKKQLSTSLATEVSVDDAQVESPLNGDGVTYEEDKRRRNTEASARFRIKKKQREQAVAEEAKVLRTRVDELESLVDNLKMENAWLRGLIVAKGQGKSPSLDDIEALAVLPANSKGNDRPTLAKRSLSKIA